MKSVFSRLAVRAALCTALIFMLCLLPSCRANQADHLAYQVYPIRVQGLLSVMGQDYPLTIEIPSEGNARLAFTGGRLEGTVIGVSGGGVFFLNGEASFPLKPSQQSPLMILPNVFALTPSQKLSVDTASDCALYIGYECGNGRLYVTLTDGLPSAMEYVGQGGFELKINKFTCGAD